MTRAAFHGFIISNKGWSDQILLEMGISTIAGTAADAWRRHIGHEKAATMDFPILVQRWSDKGYKPFRVTLSLDPKIDEGLHVPGRAALREETK